MRYIIFNIITVIALLSGCNDNQLKISEEERLIDYANRIIFIDTIVDIPSLENKKPIREVMIECKVDERVVNRSSVRYALNGTLIGADNMKLIDGTEMLSTIEKKENNQWHKRLFNNVSVISSENYITNEEGFIVGATDTEAQRYEYNDKKQLIHSVEFHTLEGVLLTDYEYNDAGLLSQLIRSIYPTGGGSKIASIVVKYFYNDDGQIIRTENISELIAMDLRIKWHESYQDPDEYGNWRSLPLGEMTTTLISTGIEDKGTDRGAECKREITYY